MSFPVHQRFAQLAAFVIGCALLPASALSQISFQSQQVAQSPSVSDIAAHGDFNNDGREDLMITRYTSAPGLLYLSSGDGTYQAPINLPQGVSPGFAAIGDFNGDGKLDFAGAGASGSQMRIYLGNGNGTFQAAKAVADSTASGESIQAIVAADVNHDGKTDLVEIVTSSSNVPVLQVWISNGNGTFTAGQRISNVLGGLFGAYAGDFDGDGKPDIAMVYADKGPATVQIYYGDGAGHFGSPFKITDPNSYDDPNLHLADINNDGRSDLVSSAFIYGVSGTSQFLPKLAVFSGNSNRTLSYSNITTNQCPGGVAVADFTGDGINDLAYSEASCTTASTSNFVIRPGTGKGSFGAEQTVYQNTYNIFQPSTVRSTIGTEPDLIFTENLGPNNNPSTNPPEALVLLSNSSRGAFPNCGIIVAEGINICQPQPKSASPVIFSLATAGPTPMRTAAVWVDGKKVDEQLAHAFSNYSFLDASIPMTFGTHKITIFGTGWDNTLQQKTFSVDVNSTNGCGAPTSPGVDLCQPAQATTVSSPVQIRATATVTGTFARMEVWIDGVKKYTQTTNPVLLTTIPVSAGSHRFGVFAVNTAGTKWEAVVTATVK
jgi:FG-GAP-like repeat/Bacterial Ig domain